MRTNPIAKNPIAKNPIAKNPIAKNRVAVWAATGIIGAGVAGGLTYAAVATPAAASSDLGSSVDGALNAAATPAPGARARAGMGMGRRGLLNRVEHGELTVRTKQSDRTVDLQRGVVSAVSPTSISVTSPDKFAGTYTVDSSTKVRTRSGLVSISSVHTGDQVLVVATAGKAIRILDPGKHQSG
jgi:hypothetical protein